MSIRNQEVSRALTQLLRVITPTDGKISEDMEIFLYSITDEGMTNLTESWHSEV